MTTGQSDNFLGLAEILVATQTVTIKPGEEHAFKTNVFSKTGVDFKNSNQEGYAVITVSVKGVVFDGPIPANYDNSDCRYMAGATVTIKNTGKSTFTITVHDC